jgi:two-component system, OmpR family, sensor kinase
MGPFAPRRHSRLLLRTYAVIVGGLIATAALFDYGFGRLQEAFVPASNAWVDGNLTLIERRIADAPADRREATVAALERELGFPVSLLPLDAVVRFGEAATERTSEIFDEQGRATFLRMSQRLGAAIRIGPITADDTPRSRLLNTVPHLFYLTIFVLVAVWLWPLIRDVDLLTRAARDFAADYRQPMTTRTKATTLEELAGSLDEMSARIHGLIQGQKDLTSALSHEIRTPLARIKFAMAVIGSKEPIAAELESINDDVREIDRLIATMLEFARLDHPDTEVRWQPIPIAELIAQTAGKCLLREGQRIDYDAPQELVPMDPRLMDLALSNLVVNACRYAVNRVRITFAGDVAGYSLAVDDDGPGIPEAQREAIFKAFARLDTSRNRETGGYGLGLAIVARIAALHGGSARAEQSALGGARIVISWPRRGDASDGERRSERKAAAAAVRSGS